MRFPSYCEQMALSLGARPWQVRSNDGRTPLQKCLGFGGGYCSVKNQCKMKPQAASSEMLWAVAFSPGARPRQTQVNHRANANAMPNAFMTTALSAGRCKGSLSPDEIVARGSHIKIPSNLAVSLSLSRSPPGPSQGLVALKRAPWPSTGFGGFVAFRRPRGP